MAAAAAAASPATPPCCTPTQPGPARLDSSRLSTLCRTCRTGYDGSLNIPPCSGCTRIPAHPHRRTTHDPFQTPAPCSAPAASVRLAAQAPDPQFRGPDNCRAIPASKLFPCRYHAPALRKFYLAHPYAQQRTPSIHSALVLLR